MATKETAQLIAKYGRPSYPKPRYSINECLILLDESRRRFYVKVNSGRYKLTEDGSRRYMTHEQLLDAADGDRSGEAAGRELAGLP